MIAVFFLGLIFSFVGYTPPSVLNMTALKIRLESNKRELTKFSLGASLVVFIQAMISVYLTDYINRNPDVLLVLEKTGILVLLALSVYFFKKDSKEKKYEKPVKKPRNIFLKGMLLSLLNMFAIPFFCGIIALLTSFRLMNFDVYSIYFFLIGTMIGAYSILTLYGKYAIKIEEKTGKMTQNINLILCCITATFAVFTFLKFVV